MRAKTCSFCERCLEPMEDETRHGWQRCPLEPREADFQVNASLLYNFVDTNVTHKPTQIYSKRQWKRFLKTHGCTDDFSWKDTPMKPARTQPFDSKWRHEVDKAIGKAIQEVKQKPYSTIGRRFTKEETRTMLQNDKARQRRVYAETRHQVAC